MSFWMPVPTTRFLTLVSLQESLQSRVCGRSRECNKVTVQIRVTLLAVRIHSPLNGTVWISERLVAPPCTRHLQCLHSCQRPENVSNGRFRSWRGCADQADVPGTASRPLIRS